jgi:hypothetical protein
VGAIVREAFLAQEPGTPVDQSSMSKAATNFIHALAAVLAGNALYFLLLRHLPPRARHVPFHIDLGLVVDFWLGLVAFGIIKTVAGLRRNWSRSKS